VEAVFFLKMDYNPTSILLTGGAGFIGSHVLCYLTKKYPKVNIVCLDKLSYCSSKNNFKDIENKPNFTFIKGDILSQDLLFYIFSSFKIDTIMHFAAETHVDNSFGSSINFTKNNILGTHILLETTRAFSPQVKKFIHVSTDEVYGESTLFGAAKTVKSALNPSNPYAATKAGAEFLVRSYCQSFNFPAIITRGNNVYGPKQFPEKLIPKFILLLSKGKPCPIYGDGRNLRSFLYVDDVCNAFDIILHKGKIGEIYNVGTNFEISNLEVLHKLVKEFGKQKELDKCIKYVKDRAFNDFRYHINSTNLEELGWKRKIDFEEGLRKTKEWYLSHTNWWGDVSSSLVAHPDSKPTNLRNTFKFPLKKNIRTSVTMENGNEKVKKKIKTN